MDVCSTYIASVEHLALAGLLRVGSNSQQAADAIRNGEADVIVAAYRDAKLELSQEIEAVGGHVEYVQLGEVSRLTVRSIIASLARRLDWSAPTIARAIGANTQDVRDHLRRSTLPPKK
jgi:hypothetical protein